MLLSYIPCNNLVVAQQRRIPAGYCYMEILFNPVPPLSWDICTIEFIFKNSLVHWLRAVVVAF